MLPQQTVQESGVIACHDMSNQLTGDSTQAEFR